MSTTTDLSKFGFRELKLLELTLTAMREKGLPNDFDLTGVTPMFNMDSGEVFLTNDDCQVAMRTDEGKLETWHCCYYCSHEGFLSDFEHDPQDQDCVDCMRDAGVPLDENYKYEQ